MPRIMNLDEISPFDVHVSGKSLPRDEVRRVMADSVRNCCGNRPELYVKKGGRFVSIGKFPKCDACQRILELMPSAKEPRKP